MVICQGPVFNQTDGITRRTRGNVAFILRILSLADCLNFKGVILENIGAAFYGHFEITR